MNLTLAGYFRKAIVGRPAWISASGVDEICSVSHCVSEAPDDWVNWLHHELGWFNSPALAATVNSISPLRLFAYRILPMRYRQGEGEAWTLPSDVRPVPLSASFHALGFDAVSRSMDCILGFECSPLSCCDLAADFGANKHCLLDTVEAAIDVARRFSVEQPEPGPYHVVEVLESTQSS